MKDLIELFESHQVKYTLVDGFAVNYYGYVRTTQDIDLLIYPSLENAEKNHGLPKKIGFGQADIPRKYFEVAGSAIHLGVEPNRINILTHLIGISNDQIFNNIKKVKIDNIFINIISLNNLLNAKRKSKRLKDLADTEKLSKNHNQTE